MQELQIFRHPDFGEMGLIEIDGKPYFPATACAKMLGYANPYDAIKRHCKPGGLVKREGGSIVTNQYGEQGTQVVQIKYITEGNLYRLITHSKLPAAEEFERWVFDEVLPTIRRQGSYMPDITAIIRQTVAEVMKQMIPAMVTALQTAIRPESTSMQFDPIEPQYTVNQCKMETFPNEIVEQVNDMICEMEAQQELNFSRIARFCTINGYMITSPAVKRYYNRHFVRKR